MVQRRGHQPFPHYYNRTNSTHSAAELQQFNFTPDISLLTQSTNQSTLTSPRPRYRLYSYTQPRFNIQEEFDWIQQRLIDQHQQSQTPPINLLPPSFTNSPTFSNFLQTRFPYTAYSESSGSSRSSVQSIRRSRSISPLNLNNQGYRDFEEEQQNTFRQAFREIDEYNDNYYYQPLIGGSDTANRPLSPTEQIVIEDNNSEYSEIDINTPPTSPPVNLNNQPEQDNDNNEFELIDNTDNFLQQNLERLR